MTVDFKAQLFRQLNFLSSSCRSFDAGHHDEAIRIAQVIRIIMHDTTRQRSVLSHLNAKGIRLVSNCMDITTKMRRGVGNVQLFNGMGQIEMGPGGARYYPKGLDNDMFRHDIQVDQWWNETVFVLDPQSWISRKDVVLCAADKDGGAHVDAALTPAYERLMESGDLGNFADEHGNQTPITGHHFVALRQMGNELFASQELIALVEEFIPKVR